ncbi:nuclear transport factor 2 family protein [Gangjinia marincola]|uniref:Nuclear transport factor 2 family protein n=1 Tax=Gangjinia marincola TaxID=578463 RepID=A0ABP3XU87_9FLAO
MSAPDQIIAQFYRAFKALDGDAMAACYHDEITFTDPAFGTLQGDEAKNMWRMLCQSQLGKDFTVTYRDIQQTYEAGSAVWETHYLFSKTGRKVHNIVNANFELKDGLIYTHTDKFDLHRWATQTMGIKGYLLGWTSFFKRKLQQQTNAMLTAFERSQE